MSQGSTVVRWALGARPRLRHARHCGGLSPTPQFRKLLAAQTASRWGDTFNSVALVILVYRLTGSGLQVAATVAFEIAPVLLFGFVTGAVVDRRPRRQVMIAADLGRVLVALLLAAFGGELAVLYAGAFLLSTFSVFFNPAADSILPAIVDDDDLVGANSAVWSVAVISQIVLAPVAGALVAVAGATPAFLINAASFAVSGALLWRLTLPAQVPRAASKHLADVAEGLRAIRTSRFLTVLSGVQGLRTRRFRSGPLRTAVTVRASEAPDPLDPASVETPVAGPTAPQRIVLSRPRDASSLRPQALLAAVSLHWRPLLAMDAGSSYPYR